MERGRKFKTTFHIIHVPVLVLKDLLFIYVYASVSLLVCLCICGHARGDQKMQIYLRFTMYMYVHLCMCGSACVGMQLCGCLWRPREVRSPETGVPGHCEPPNMDWTPVFYKSINILPLKCPIQKGCGGMHF